MVELPFPTAIRDNFAFSNDSPPSHETECHEELRNESVLPLVLRRLDQAGLEDLIECQKSLLELFSIKTIVEQTDRLIGEEGCSSLLAIVRLPQFQFELQSLSLESQLTFLSFIACNSRNPSARASAISEGIRLIRKNSRTIVLNDFSRKLSLRTCEQAILSFLLMNYQESSQAALDIFEILFECSVYGPGELSKFKAISGLKQVAKQKGVNKLSEEANSGDERLRFQAIHLLGFLRSTKALLILLRLYVKRDSERETVEKVIMKYYSSYYRVTARGLASREPNLTDSLQVLID